MADNTGKMRKPNIELLRILAMLMIITLHYLDKGDILDPFIEAHGMNQRIAWILEIMSLVSVNLYVLISGYFLSKTEFRFRKVILLWLQVIFYSYVIGAVFFALNQIPADQKTFYDLIFIVLPVTASHYWFATIYVAMFFLFPFLNVGIAHMERKQYKILLVALLAILSLWKSILPFTIPRTDQGGMDLLWFVFLYLIAAYIRKYPDCLKAKRYVYVLGYIGSVLLTYAYGILLVFIDQKFGKLGGYAANLCGYNSVTMLAGAVCLFALFLKTERNVPDWIGKGIVCLGSCTFGVFLIHEHQYMRYYWPKLFHVADYKESPFLFLHWIVTILVVFLLCAGLEKLRQLLFGLVTKRKFFERWMQKSRPLEDKINGIK